MATTGQKMVAAVAASFGLGYGAYYSTQISEISKIDKDRKDIETMVETERKRVSSTTRGAADLETKITDLTKASSDKQRAVKELEVKLDAARKQVQQLEAQVKAKAEDAKKVAEDLANAQTRLAELRTEGQRAKEALTMGERSLVIANQKAAEAKLLLNPLNHPKVKKLLNRP